MYMKRVVVIAIIIAVIATLFAFPVFAVTPVQPLQVITYSDTTTNVRISGTAERLHYNIDSFQVVFMNPPNNYGTACTPVLVSFRFYNSSELPAYVGQAEFELTATTGTGAVNTIIYGYDQISTDLFVAESSYSTAEVGRIGIGASNDFAYYTGFVIPPKTSLYFSCVVYVNASAYAQNNTGATEDVNQVTLSSLNLYINQISFSADYPYHNQPIDFSSIIDAITNFDSSNGELYQLIESLRQDVIYSGTVPSVNMPTFNNNVQSISTGISGYYISAYRFVSNPQIITLDYEYDSTNDTYTTLGTYRYYIKIIIEENNSSGSNLRTYFRSRIDNLISPNLNGFVVDSIFSDTYSSYNVNSGNLTLFKKNLIGNRYILDTNYHVHVVECHIDVPIGQTITINTPDYSNWFVNVLPVKTDIYAPSSEYLILRDLYLAYSSVNGLDDIDNTADDIKDKSESAHTQEQSYFTQNAQAIQQTGLSNYRFNGDQENGIGSVSHDFTLLWNALGGFNSIYIFSLTLSLALMILRHAPGVIRSSRRNKEE